ncbi:MAG: PD-(D/E)XK nuclease family protein, partial [bacterium]|nr:PD-(D/E)XK nuclease family protein [bacterium]
YLQTCSVPFPGTPLHGLQVLGLLETRNIQFDRVFILDCNEGILPSTTKEDTLLPYPARCALGLPTYQDREKLISYYLETLLSSANESHLFFIETAEIQRSRYIEHLLWQKQKADKNPDTNQYIETIQYKVNLNPGLPAPVKKTDEIIQFLRQFEYNPTAINLYLSCPLQFYYKQVLGITEKDEVAVEIERGVVGKFIHTILQLYFTNKLNRVLTPNDLNESELNQIIDREFREAFGHTLTGSTYLLYRQTKNHLTEFIRGYQKEMVTKHTITLLGLEDRITITKNGFNLKGFIDRVEQRDGLTVIVDYKSGASDSYLTINFDKLAEHQAEREVWKEYMPSVQLPFYLLLYSEKHHIELEKLDSMIYLLGKKGLTPENIELPLIPVKKKKSDSENETTVTPEEKSAKLNLAFDIIFKVLNEIINPDIDFTPTPEMKDTCPTCAFRYLCNI